MSPLRFRLPWAWSSRPSPEPEPEPVADDDPDVPKMYYASDADGDRQAIVQASEFDMSGWTVESIDGDGRVSVDEFHQRELPKTGPSGFSFVAGGDWMPVWIAAASWGSDGLTLIDPQGERREMSGYISS